MPFAAFAQNGQVGSPAKGLDTSAEKPIILLKELFNEEGVSEKQMPAGARSSEQVAPAPLPTVRSAKVKEEAPAPLPTVRSAKVQEEAPAPLPTVRSAKAKEEAPAPLPTVRSAKVKEEAPAPLPTVRSAKVQEEAPAPLPTVRSAKVKEEAPAPLPTVRSAKVQEEAPAPLPTVRSAKAKVEAPAPLPSVHSAKIHEDVPAAIPSSRESKIDERAPAPLPTVKTNHVQDSGTGVDQNDEEAPQNLNAQKSNDKIEILDESRSSSRPNTPVQGSTQETVDHCSAGALSSPTGLAKTFRESKTMLKMIEDEELRDYEEMERKNPIGKAKTMNRPSDQKGLSPFVQKLLKFAKIEAAKPSRKLCATCRTIYRPGRAKGACLQGVRMAFQKAAGQSTGSGWTLNAKDAGPHLKKYGYHKISLSERDKAPPGSVFIFHAVNNPRKAGHIEIKGTDGYYSDFYEPVTIDKRMPTRRLAEVWVPGE
jgi:hypothetical protein